MSGSGKTTLILESLIPALEAQIARKQFPSHIKAISAESIQQVKLIDATPIGVNVRSTVAKYANVHDELRKIYARTPESRTLQYKAGDFSYNTGQLRCPTCDGTGTISLDVQFLPNIEIPCPDCWGTQYAKKAELIKRKDKAENAYSLPEIMAMDVKQALAASEDLKTVAQRLKLASEMGRKQTGTVFVFDEPTIGLHPLDVRTLLQVFDRLVKFGATVLVIEHDLDMISNSDYLIDMGPGGGNAGGRIVAVGTPEEVMDNPQSVTGKYLKQYKTQHSEKIS